MSQIRFTQQPTTVIELAEDVKIKVYVRPLHEDFIRPYTVDDIEKVLKTIPLPFVRGIRRIILLGGTKKQNQIAQGNLFKYGAYSSTCWIALSAYPKRMMTITYNGPARPHREQEYQKTFTKTFQEGDE